MTLEEKYKRAITALQAIAQRSGGYKDGGIDEWSEAEAFNDCQIAAIKCLKRIGEDTCLHPSKTKTPKSKEAALDTLEVLNKDRLAPQCCICKQTTTDNGLCSDCEKAWRELLTDIAKKYRYAPSDPATIHKMKQDIENGFLEKRSIKVACGNIEIIGGDIVKIGFLEPIHESKPAIKDIVIYCEDL